MLTRFGLYDLTLAPVIYFFGTALPPSFARTSTGLVHTSSLPGCILP